MTDDLSGTVTLLMTDIHDSMSMWQLHPRQMPAVVARYNELVAEAVEANDGSVLSDGMEGDGCLCVCEQTSDAIAAACQLQRAIQAEDWPDPICISVRIALHSGETDQRAQDCYRQLSNRCARLREVAHGGQILVSEPAYRLAVNEGISGAQLLALGEHRLRDQDLARPIYQILADGLKHEFPALASVDTVPNNLPNQISSFVGREQEHAALVELLQSQRLITLTGPGGCGKTRLAVHLAADVLPSYEDGVWLVDLSVAESKDDVLRGAAAAVGVRETAGTDLLDALAARLQTERVLLLVDNCEHVREASAKLAGALLRACDRLRIVATSREPLGVAGERVFVVPPLSLPREALDCVITSSLQNSEAVRLLVERITSIDSHFAIGDAIAPAIGRLVHLLDGNPLAIELAAPLIAGMSATEACSRLETAPLADLVSHDPAAPERHRSVLKVIGSSYDCLDATQRKLLLRLSVFKGAILPESAKAVCAYDGVAQDSVSPALSELVRKSLVNLERPDPASLRYRLQWTVKHFALEQLSESGEENAARRRHAEYHLRLAERAAEKLTGPSQLEWLDRIEQHHGDILAALRWLRGSGDCQRALRLSGALWRYWYMRGHHGEGREQLERALQACDESQRTPERALALHGLGTLIGLYEDHEEAGKLLERAAQIRRELGDNLGAAGSMANIAIAAYHRADFDTARQIWEESLPLWRTAGSTWGVATALKNLAGVAYVLGSYAEVRAKATESMELYSEIGDAAGVAGCHSILGLVDMLQDRPSAARCHHQSALEAYTELGDRSGIAQSHKYLGEILLKLGSAAAASEHCEKSISIHRELAEPRQLASALVKSGLVAYRLGDLDEARRCCTEARDLLGPVRAYSPLASALRNLGIVETARGNLDAARAHLRDSLESLRQLEHHRSYVDTLEAVALLAASQGDMREAQLFAWSAQEARLHLGLVADPSIEGTLEELLALLDSEPPEPSAAEARILAATTPMEAVIDSAAAYLGIED